ncbi:MAG: hypothetical protein AAGL34_01415 [Bacteroidota bacterium]
MSVKIRFKLTFEPKLSLAFAEEKKNIPAWGMYGPNQDLYLRKPCFSKTEGIAFLVEGNHR